jgi:hypothetical protein
VVWEYEVPLFGKELQGGHGPEAFGNSVFSAIRLANGNTLIGTGNGHSVLEVTPKKEIVWKVAQREAPGHYPRLGDPRGAPGKWQYAYRKLPRWPRQSAVH